jgi:hypothetical protein
MKPKSMTSLIAKSLTVFAACAALNASAGTAPAKNPAPVEPEPATLFESIGADLSAAYDSRYYFRGLWFADNIITTTLNLSVPLSEKLTWGVGAAYISTVETPINNPPSTARNSFDYSEIDLYSSLTYNAGWAKFGVQYQYYFYPDFYAGSNFGAAFAGTDPEFGITGAGELGLTAAIPLGAANIYLGYYYDFRVGGSYCQAAADYTVALTDWLSIVPAVQAGYGFNYYTGNASPALVNWAGMPLGTDAQTCGWTHFLFSVATPVKLTKTATFTPYAAYNVSMDLRQSLNATPNELFWGAKLTLTF